MGNRATFALALSLTACATTPCEREASIRDGCATSTAGEQAERELPMCAKESIEACRARCGLEYQDDLCDILDQVAPTALIDEYTDCLATCAETDGLG